MIYHLLLKFSDGYHAHASRVLFNQQNGNIHFITETGWKARSGDKLISIELKEGKI